MTDPLHPLQAHLQQHGDALRELARALLGSADDAADAVQETWHRALRSPPRHGERLAGWYATLLHNVVRRVRRSARRRAQREAAVAAARVDAFAADAGAELVRTETTRALLAAIDALEPPFRDVIWQRWFEGKPPRVIAAASGVPLATVKSRLQRGLGMLRAQLGKNGDRDWRDAFALAFALPGKKTAALAAAGATTMGMAGTVAKIAAVVGVLVGVFAWPWRSVEPPPVSAATNGRGVAARASVEAVPASTAPDVARVPSTLPAPTPLLAATETAWRGRVVAAESGAPLAGVAVVVAEHTRHVVEPGDRVVVTGDDGRFEVQATAGRGARVWLRKADRVQLWWSGSPVGAGEVDDVGDVALRAGLMLAGTVVDETGAPLAAGTTITARAASTYRGGVWFDSGECRAVVGDGGTFAFATGVAAGPIVFALEGGRHRLVARAARELDRSTTELVLRAEPRPAIRGVVVDAGGAPIAGIGIARYPTTPEVVTAADGTFELLWQVGMQLTSTFVVDAPEHEPLPQRTVAWGTDDLRIVLRPARTVDVEVVDDRGVPVEHFGVVLRREGLRAQADGAVRQRGRHTGGVCTVRGVAPGATGLRVVPVDDELTPSAMFDVATAAPLRVVLARRSTVRVLVRSEGRPVPDALVETAFADPERSLEGYLPDLLEPHRGERAPGCAERVGSARTAADGTATLRADRERADRWLRVQSAGRAPFVLREPVFPLDGSPLHVDVPGAGAVVGRVELRGALRQGVHLALIREGQAWRRFHPGPDGAFRVEIVPTGTWTIELGTKGVWVESRRELVVRDGAQTRVDYDLAQFPPAALHGRIDAAAMLPPEPHVALFRLGVQARHEQMAIVPVGPDGSFVAADLLPGTYRIALRVRDANVGAASQPLVPAFVEPTVALAPGERREVSFRAPRRRLVVAFSRPDGTSAAGVQLLARCDGVQWPSFAMSAPVIGDRLVLDPAPLLPVEFRSGNVDAPWSAPVVMPDGVAEHEVSVVLPEAPR